MLIIYRQVGEMRTKGGGRMYPNLLGQKSFHHLTDADMAKIIGVSRTAYGQKIKSGRFWPEECRAYCKYFKKSFDYLFALPEDIDKDS